MPILAVLTPLAGGLMLLVAVLAVLLLLGLLVWSWRDRAFTSTASVADAYDLGAGSSSITSYRRLMALKEKGLVDIAVMEDDRRKRTVTFTAVAEDLFSRLAL